METENDFKCLVSINGFKNGDATHECLGFSSLQDQINFTENFCTLEQINELEDESLRSIQINNQIGSLFRKLRNDLLLNGYEQNTVDRCSRKLQKEKVKLYRVTTNGPLLSTIEQDDLDGFKKHFSLEAINNDVDRRGHTLLHYATYLNSTEIVKFLLDNNADINVRDDRGLTPLDLAKEEDLRPEMAKILEEEAERRKGVHSIRHRCNKQHRRRDLPKKERSIHLESKGASHSIENDNSAIESNQATSGASKSSFWINTFTNTVVGAVKGVFQLISAPFEVSLPLTSENSSNHSDKIRNPSNQYTGQFGSEVCMSNNVALGFFLLQSFLDKKYPLPKSCSITPEEALTNTLNITEKFGQILRETAKQSRISVKGFDFFTVYLNVADHVRNERYSQIPTTLYSAAKDAYPKNEKFLSILKGNIEKMLDGQQV